MADCLYCTKRDLSGPSEILIHMENHHLVAMGFSDALHSALWADDRYAWVDEYEYDFLDDFTRRTSHMVAGSVTLPFNGPKWPGMPSLVKMMIRVLLEAGACSERFFYRYEQLETEFRVTYWGMMFVETEVWDGLVSVY